MASFGGLFSKWLPMLSLGSSTLVTAMAAAAAEAATAALEEASAQCALLAKTLTNFNDVVRIQNMMFASFEPSIVFRRALSGGPQCE